MSELPDAKTPTQAQAVWRNGAFGLGLAIICFVLFSTYGKSLAPWAFSFPKTQTFPVARWISQFTKWLINDATFGLFTFTDLTRFIAAVIDLPYQIALSLFATGFMSGPGSSAVQLLPPISWIAVIAIVGLMGFYIGGRRLALVVASCFVFIAVFGQWTSAMVTLASILVAVPLGIAGGLFRDRSLSLEMARARFAAATRSDADHPGFRLSGADPFSVRVWRGGGGCRHFDLRHAANDTGDHACLATRHAGGA